MANVETALRRYGLDVRGMEPPPDGRTCQRWLQECRNTVTPLVQLDELLGQEIPRFDDYGVYEHGTNRGVPYTMVGGIMMKDNSPVFTHVAFSFGETLNVDQVRALGPSIPFDKWISVEKV